MAAWKKSSFLTPKMELENQDCGLSPELRLTPARSERKKDQNGPKNAGGGGVGGGRGGVIFCISRFFSVKGSRMLKFRLFPPNREL